MVVVLLNGSALAVNWAKQNARALLEAWYPGQSGGQAIAETLSGKNNPAGRLPVTFYTGIDQLPAFDDYSMANRTYRYFKGKPLLCLRRRPQLHHLRLLRPEALHQNLKAGRHRSPSRPTCKNTGSLPGDEVSELYLIPPQSAIVAQTSPGRLSAPPPQPRRNKTLTFTLDPRTLSQVDEKGTRAVTPRQLQAFAR